MINDKKLDWALGLGIFLIAFGVYFSTMAPTVSFWDCGELIAASNILGNPHPPGNPLLTLLMRVFIIVVPFAEKAARANFLSVVSSALTVTVSFFFILKALRLAFRNGGLNKFALYAGGVTGSFLVAFGDTFWFSAVEAEAYGLSMFLVLTISWLALHWYEHRGTAVADRTLLMIGYLGFLGMGVHPFSFITIPVVGLFLLLDRRTWSNVPLLLAGLALFSVIYDIGDFIFYAAGALAVCVLGRFLARAPEWRHHWALAGALCFVALLGFSSYLYVPIRSAANVSIDEGEPQDFKEYLAVWNRGPTNAFKEYLERKQYGSDSMLRRAFHRRGSWNNQVLIHPHMGFGGYLMAQYFPWKVGDASESESVVRRIGGKEISFAPLYESLRGKVGTQMLLFLLLQIPFLWGGWLIYKRDKRLGLYVLGLYAVTSYALIFYINFSDGTRMELRDFQAWVEAGRDSSNMPPPVHLEVRERDYFFTPGFIYMGVLFGISATFLLNWMTTRARAAVKPVGVAVMVLSLAVPVFSNYREHDRTGDYVPWDYAYNLLNSCRPNSILFTNGDNDTFPLWFLQEVEGIRTDVRVVNLSLVNTNWYMHQLLEHEPKLKLGFTHEQIDQLQPQRWPFRGAVEITIPNTSIRYALQPLPYLRVQDIMVLNLVQNNYPERPVHFAVTIGSDNAMGLDQFTVMEGMVYTLVQEPKNREIDVAATARLVDSVYRFRGLGDPKVYIDRNTEGLLTNYSATNFRLAAWAQDSLQKIVDRLPSAQGAQKAALEASRDSMLAFAEKYFKLNATILPNEWRVHYYRGQMHAQMENYEKAEEAFRAGLAVRNPNARVFALGLAQLFLQQERAEDARKILEDARKRFPADLEIAFALAELHRQNGDMPSAAKVLSDWLSANPKHEYAQHVAGQLQQIQSAPAPMPAPTPED
jgi:tetratricopeptide (TPR) repeat protein